MYVIHTLTIRWTYAEYARCTLKVRYSYVGINGGQFCWKYIKGLFPPFSSVIDREKMEAALLQHQFVWIHLTLHYIKRKGRQKRKNMSRMGGKHFCRHLKSNLQMNVTKQSTMEMRYYSYLTQRFTYVMHTLCIRNSYTRIRYTCITYTIAYVMHTLLIRLHTLRIRW